LHFEEIRRCPDRDGMIMAHPGASDKGLFTARRSGKAKAYQAKQVLLAIEKLEIEP
jgi:hypothetical protein